MKQYLTAQAINQLCCGIGTAMTLVHERIGNPKIQRVLSKDYKDHLEYPNGGDAHPFTGFIKNRYWYIE